MKAVDTNVLARVVLGDDERQSEAAMELLRAPVWVPVTVWLELGWVLGRRLGMNRVAISDALLTLLTLETVHTISREGLLWAVDRLRAGADWADMVHLVSAQGVAETFATFDRDLDRAAGSTTPVVVETLA